MLKWEGGSSPPRSKDVSLGAWCRMDRKGFWKQNNKKREKMSDSPTEMKMNIPFEIV